MEKKQKKVNLLIKKNLVNLLKKKGIKCINSEVLVNLNDYFTKEMNSLAEAIKQEMLIQGKKTFDKSVLYKVYNKL